MSLSSGDERKIEAYDAAHATVKIEGNSRAYYVLRAEVAEAKVERLRAQRDYYRRRWLIHGIHFPSWMRSRKQILTTVKTRFVNARALDGD